MTNLREVSGDSLSDPQAFRQDVMLDCRPVVLRGVAKAWPLVVAARSGDLARYLLQFDSGREAEMFVGAPAIRGRYHYGEDLAGFNFERRQLGFGAALAAMLARGDDREAPSMYMGSLSTDTYLPGFAEQNRLPLVPETVRPRIWLGTESQVACHHDTADNVACVAAGHRRFTLFPPEAIGDLYIGPIDHTMAGQPVSLAVGSERGDPRFPRFERVRDEALVVELEPGDAVYIPKLWWHQVEALDPFNILVNYWWDGFASGPDQPNTAMMLAMIAIAERPAGERAAWAAFFDHYVFRPERHPLEHLPAERHGILGPLVTGNYGRIRSVVMRLLRGG